MAVHPDYADLQPWTGRETSDIVYTDTEGVLTAHLGEKGYLDPEIWAPETGPRYFIEVKATTSSCDKAFYMSKAQYAMVRDASLFGLLDMPCSCQKRGGHKPRCPEQALLRTQAAPCRDMSCAL